MKTLFTAFLLSAVLCLSLSTASHAINVTPGKLANDGTSSIQAFIPDPAKAQVPINLATTKVFKKGTGADYNITDWTAINIIPSTTNITRYFNSDSTKTRTIYADQDNIIIIHPDVTQITISGVDASVEVEGM